MSFIFKKYDIKEDHEKPYNSLIEYIPEILYFTTFFYSRFKKYCRTKYIENSFNMRNSPFFMTLTDIRNIKYFCYLIFVGEKIVFQPAFKQFTLQGIKERIFKYIKIIIIFYQHFRVLDQLFGVSQKCEIKRSFISNVRMYFSKRHAYN